MKAWNWTAAALAAAPAALALAIWLGGPEQPVVQNTISSAFSQADYSTVPPVTLFKARDGERLAYRRYANTGTGEVRGSVVLVHGSSATSQSMHLLATALAAAEHEVYALDIRGHGDSGTKGRVDYIGQLEDDLNDFLKAVTPTQPSTLVGFSSGGGFALRYAAGPDAKSFQSYVLLSPFLHQDAPTQRPDSGGWVSVGVPRIIALSVLNGFGVRKLNGLSVVRFAIDPTNRELLTESYDFSLSGNFRPNDDYQSDVSAVRQPLAVLVGERDEAFIADRFKAIFSNAPGMRHVSTLPGVDHAGLVLQSEAIAGIIASVVTLQGEE